MYSSFDRQISSILCIVPPLSQYHFSQYFMVFCTETRNNTPWTRVGPGGRECRPGKNWDSGILDPEEHL